MQQLEVDYEIRNKATYIVGSEESPPALGYPYDTIFAHFRDNPDDTTLNLAKEFVDETVAFYGTGNKITQSVIDPSQLSGLAASTSSLGDALIANVGSLGTIVPTTRSQSQKFLGAVDMDYRDLYDVCNHLISLGAPAPVITAATNVQTSIGLAVVYEGHNLNSPGSHGVSIDFSDATEFNANSHDTQYQLMQFGQDTHWSQWLTIAP
jgi:hypothetical protein